MMNRRNTSYLKALEQHGKEIVERATVFELNENNDVVVVNKNLFPEHHFFSDTIFVDHKDVSLWDIKNRTFFVPIKTSFLPILRQDSTHINDNMAKSKIRNLCGKTDVIKLHPTLKKEMFSDPLKSLSHLKLKFNNEDSFFEILDVLTFQPNNDFIVNTQIFSYVLNKIIHPDIALASRWKDDATLINEWRELASTTVEACYLNEYKTTILQPEQIAFIKAISNDSTLQEKSQMNQPVKKAEMLNVRSGYEKLADVLTAAIDQAQNGKGNARHQVGDVSFDNQPICELARLYGTGYNFGQAAKKAHETNQLGSKDAKIAELLGAINYLAAAVIVISEEER